MTPRLTFHGAAGCVTGSCMRLETDQATVLIDCGMFQGSKTLKALNYEPFPFDADKVDAVLLTHAHIDHSGLLPKLVRAGFRGSIHATAATRDLCALMLADSAHIQESEVEYLNRRNLRRGRPPVTPIYTRRDVAPTLRRFSTIGLHEAVKVAPGITATWWDAGHMLGSTSIEVRVETDEGPMTLLFSGDVGPGGREYAADPEGPIGVDHLIVESTYGDRERPPLDPAARRRLLAAEVRDAHEAGGPLVIPAFAVERTQELLVDLLTIMADGQAPAGNIFLDSPLAIEVGEVFIERGWDKAAARNPFESLQSSEHLHLLRKPWESDKLDMLKGWHIIVAASGMCDAGRIRKHLKRLLWRRDATVLLSGFQVVGTLGRLLQDGLDRVKIQGEDIRVQARIRSLDVYSGHADAAGLAGWAMARGPVAGSVFLNHGEPGALEGLGRRLAAGGVAADRITIPAIDSCFSLRRQAAEPQAAAGRIPPGAAATLDWHNARARFLLDLDERLERAADDAERQALLETLAGGLASPPR